MKIFLYIILCLFTFFTSTAQASEVSQTTISSVTINWDGETEKRVQAESLVPFQAGDIISTDTIPNTQKELESYPLFESVDIQQGEREKNGTPLIVNLKSIRPIRKIHISGEYPFLEKKISRLLSLQPGDRYKADELDENRKRIESFFIEHGYYDTEIELTTSDDNKHFSKNLNIKIHKGTVYRLKKVSVDGNTHIKSETINNKLKGFGHFSLKKTKAKIKKIEAKYNKKGYVRARIRLNDITFDRQQKTANLSLTVRENKHLKTSFSGNRYFSNQTLEKHLTFSQEEGYSRFDLDRSVERLHNFYLTNGFRDSSITGSFTKETQSEITAHFSIDEGKRSRVRKIELIGNKKIPKKKIRKQMKQEVHSFTRQGFFEKDKIENDSTLIENLYQGHGYLDAYVSNLTIKPNNFGDLVDITINIEEGKIYTINSFSLIGNKEIDTQRLSKKIDLKKSFDKGRLEKNLQKLRDFYLDLGYPHIEITPEIKINKETQNIDLAFIINEGPRTRIGKILIMGNHITTDNTIRKTLKFKEGNLYSYKRILDGQLNLKRLGIFDFVRIDPHGLDEKNPAVNVIVNVTERKTFTLDLQGGFDSDKLGSGQVIMTRRNLFGIGKQLQIRGVGGFEFDRGEITFYSPRLFGASWNLVNQYFAQYENRPNFNATTIGGSVGTLKPFGPNWTLFLKEQISRFNIDEAKSNKEALAKNLFDNTFSEASISTSFDSRNNYANPTRGFYGIISTELNTDLSNPTNNFNISQLKVSHYFGFLKLFTLINTARVGKILDVNSSPRIPATKLFFMGGNDTVRGFDEDAIDESGGRTSIIYNGELDMTVFGDLKVAGFFDAGTLTNEFKQISKDTIRDSAGVGLRYVTPVGPIRLDYGFVLDKKPGEAGQRFHFSFGYFF